MDNNEVLSTQKFNPVNSVETLAGDESTNISSQLIKRLRDAGYHSLQSVVVLGAQQISDDTQIGLENSLDFQNRPFPIIVV